MQYIVLCAVLVLVAVFAYWYWGFGMRKNPEAEAVIGGETFRVDVADTPAKRSAGLSGISELKRGDGMIFIFDSLAKHTFWMRDTLIPLDIVWIRSGEIIGWVTAYPEPGVPATRLTKYQPPADVDTVLEVSAGEMERIGASVGDKIDIRL